MTNHLKLQGGLQMIFLMHSSHPLEFLVIQFLAADSPQLQNLVPHTFHLMNQRLHLRLVLFNQNKKLQPITEAYSFK